MLLWLLNHGAVECMYIFRCLNNETDMRYGVCIVTEINDGGWNVLPFRNGVFRVCLWILNLYFWIIQ